MILDDVAIAPSFIMLILLTGQSRLRLELIEVLPKSNVRNRVGEYCMIPAIENDVNNQRGCQSELPRCTILQLLSF